MWREEGRAPRIIVGGLDVIIKSVEPKLLLGAVRALGATSTTCGEDLGEILHNTKLIPSNLSEHDDEPVPVLRRRDGDAKIIVRAGLDVVGTAGSYGKERASGRHKGG